MSDNDPLLRFRPRFLGPWLLVSALLMVLWRLLYAPFLWAFVPLDSLGAVALVSLLLGLLPVGYCWLLYGVRVDDEGIRGGTLWGWRRRLAWAEIAEVRGVSVWGWRHWRLIGNKRGPAVWIPRALRGRIELQEILARRMPELAALGDAAPPTELGPSLAASLGILVAGAVGALLAAAAVVLSSLPYASERPAQLEEARVWVAHPDLVASPVLRDRSLGLITGLQAFPGSGPERVLAVGERGAAYLDAGFGATRRVRFSDRMDRAAAVALPAGGFAFLARGSWCCPVDFRDGDGESVWTYRDRVGVDDAAASDADGDGELDFVVGFNGGGGVHLLDAQGRRRWRQEDGNVWHVAFLDVEGDGRQEIVHSNAAGQLVVRSLDGARREVAKPESYFSDFDTLRWPGSAKLESVIHAEDDAVWLLHFDRSWERFDAPGAGSLGAAHAAALRLQPGGPELLAVAIDYSNFGRSQLYLFDAAGAILHREVREGPVGSVVALPRSDLPGSADLLLGGDGELLRYRWQPASVLTAR